MILNGGVDREGGWTYAGGRGNSIFNYALGDGDSREEVERLEIGENVESDPPGDSVDKRREKKGQG